MSVAGECPRCGYRDLEQDSNNPFPDSGTCIPPPQNECDLAEQEVARLDKAILSLQLERADCLRKLNSVRSATSVLPAEALSLIFQHIAPSFTEITSPERRFTGRDHHPPLIISSVCSYWRQVAHSTPQLWRNVSIQIRDIHDVHSKDSLLRLFFAHIRASGLAINLDYSHAFTMTPAIQTSASHIANCLYMHSANLSRLRLISPPLSWFPANFEFPILEELSIGGHLNHPDIEADLSGATSLSSLRLEMLSPQIKLPPQLIRLFLESIPLHKCIPLLMMCRNLIEFRCVRSPWYIEIPRPGPDITEAELVFPCMEVFELHYTDDEWAAAILPRLKLPALHTLGWSESNLGAVPDTTLANFFAGLSKNIRTLEFRTNTQTFHRLDHILPHLNLVRRLVLDNCSDTAVRSVLHTLQDEPFPLESDRVYLPALEELEIKAMYSHTAGNPATTDATLANFLEKRYGKRGQPGGKHGTDLCIILGQEFDWTPEVKERLRHLVAGGLPLSLLEGSEKVEWL